MTLPYKAIDEFIKIIKKNFQKACTRRSARIAENLVALYKLIARKLPEE